MRPALVPWPHTVSLDPATTTTLHPAHVLIEAEASLHDARTWLTGELSRLAGTWPQAESAHPPRVETEGEPARPTNAWREGESARLTGVGLDGESARPAGAEREGESVSLAGGAPPLRVILLIGEAPQDVPPADGIAPGRVGPDERHTVTIAPGEVTVAGPSPEAVLRGVATLVQVVEHGKGRLPLGRIADGPGLAWRGLMLDVVRHPFRVDEIRRVVDLLTRYKLNVLHLHLTDTEGWRLQSAARPGLDATSPGELITRHDLDELTTYADARGVTIVPEIDLPGHSLAATRAYPHLTDGGAAARLGYVDPGVPGAGEFIGETVTEFAHASRARFVHIGGDEPFGMPFDAYTSAVGHAVRAAHDAGKQVVAWQEAVRAGALRDGDVVQLWIGAGMSIDADAKKAELPKAAHPYVDLMVELFALAPGDGPAAAAAGLPVLVSSSDVLYLDRPYAEPAADAEGESRRARLGFRDYPAKTLREMYDWTPESLLAGLGARIAGVEAAIWSETVTCFDDLAFLLLPRLPGAAERAWTRERTSWEDHRTRLDPHDATWRATGWGAAFRPASAG